MGSESCCINIRSLLDFVAGSLKFQVHIYFDSLRSTVFSVSLGTVQPIIVLLVKTKAGSGCNKLTLKKKKRIQESTARPAAAKKISVFCSCNIFFFCLKEEQWCQRLLKEVMISLCCFTVKGGQNISRRGFCFCLFCLFNLILATRPNLNLK